MTGAVVLAAALSASNARAGAPGGELLGWVEDTQGSPVAGAVVSLFGRGLARGGVVTLSDASGRFLLPALPPGSYTLRALRSGHAPAAARQITVLPNQQSVFTVNLQPLTPEEQEAAAQASREDARELKWLVRHKRRSVLEDRAQGDTRVASSESRRAPAVPLLGDVGGTVEFVSTPHALTGDPSATDAAASFGLVRLQGSLPENGTWTLSGLLAESGTTTWRMAAEFTMQPDDDHQLQVGTGYGTRYVRPDMTADGSERSVGAVSVQERWDVTDQITATTGGRFSYVGYVDDTTHVDPLVSIEVRPDRKVRLHATWSTRTLAPGGDLLAVSSGAVPTGWAVLPPDVRPARTSRLALGVDRTAGSWTVGGGAFYESVSDPLANTFEGPEANRSLRIVNAADMNIGGVGVSLGRRFGRLFSGTLTYSLGRTWKDDGTRTFVVDEPLPGGDFHDLAARVETEFAETDTRIVAYYRLNSIVPEGEQRGHTARRFDVQLSQGLPFIGGLTRADWDVLVGIRNLFYEIGEGSTLDELTVQNPPKRVLGGVAVRF